MTRHGLVLLQLLIACIPSHWASTEGEGQTQCTMSDDAQKAATAASCVAGLRLRGGGVNRLAPAFDSLESPPVIAASKDLNMSQLFEPRILTGLVKKEWRLPENFLQHEGRKLRVDVNPLEDGDEAPRKLLSNSTLVMPATLAVQMPEVLELLRKGPEQRGFHAYVRHFSLEGHPEVASELPLARALHLAGPVLKSANLWLGDGGMRSSVHWDGHDNLLLQLVGTKTVLLLPPEATPHLGFRLWAEHRYVLDSESGNFSGHRSEHSSVENHAVFDAFDPTLLDLPQHIPLGRARVAVLQPGQALFLPALWSHAVVSGPAGSEHGAHAAKLNVAFNLWFVHACRSHQAALELQPHWAQGYFCLGNDLGSAGRAAEAAEAFASALQLKPDYFDAANNLASMLEAQGKHPEAEAQYRAAHELDPTDAKCVNNLGIVLRKQGRLEEAVAVYEQAIEISAAKANGKAQRGVLSKSYSLLGNARAMQERLHDADAAFRSAIAIAPNDAKALNSHGVVLEQLGRVEEALSAYRRSLELDPLDAKAKQNLDDLLSRHA